MKSIAVYNGPDDPISFRHYFDDDERREIMKEIRKKGSAYSFVPSKIEIETFDKFNEYK